MRRPCRPARRPRPDRRPHRHQGPGRPRRRPTPASPSIDRPDAPDRPPRGLAGAPGPARAGRGRGPDPPPRTRSRILASPSACSPRSADLHAREGAGRAKAGGPGRIRSGPYYQPEAWEASPRIAAALEIRASNEPSGEEAAALLGLTSGGTRSGSTAASPGSSRWPRPTRSSPPPSSPGSPIRDDDPRRSLDRCSPRPRRRADPPPSVRASAIAALAKLGGPGGVPRDPDGPGSDEPRCGEAIRGGGRS